MTTLQSAFKKGKLEDILNLAPELDKDIDSLTAILYKLNDGEEVTITPDPDTVRRVKAARELFQKVSSIHDHKKWS